MSVAACSSQAEFTNNQCGSLMAFLGSPSLVTVALPQHIFTAMFIMSDL